jgi:hypothetical protein
MHSSVSNRQSAPAIRRLLTAECRLPFSLLAAVVACLLAGPIVQRAAGDVFGDINVSAVAGPQVNNSSHGYAEHRFRVANRSTSRDHQVTLVMPAEAYGGGGYYVRSMSRSVTVRAGASAEVTLWQPALPVRGWGVAVFIDGREHKNRLSVNADNHGQSLAYRWSSGVSPRCLLVSRDVNPQFMNSVSSALSGSMVTTSSSPTFAPTPVGTQYEPARAESAVSEWSTHWLGYSRFDMVAVSADDMARAPAALASALWQYVEAGGVLFVAGKWETTLPAGPPRDAGGEDPFSDKKGPFRVYTVGFGVCIHAETNDGGKGWDASAWGALRNAIDQTAGPFGSMYSPAQANKVFPVVDDLSIPARGLFVLMLVFAVVIGPVNLFVLKRMRRKILLLVTAPALSGLAAASLFVYALVAEGLEGHARVSAVTLLDERQHRATTLGWSAFYSPLTPGGGLRYSPETEVTPQYGSDGYYYQNGGHGVALDWSDDQHLSGGWMSARVPLHLSLRSSQVRRERIEVHRGADGGLTAVNGLGAAVKSLWVADAEGNVFIAAGVAPGAEVKLEPNHGSVRLNTGTELRAFYSRGQWQNGAGGVATDWWKLLPKSGYVAALDSAPFVDPGLPSAEHGRDASVVIGILREPLATAAGPVAGVDGAPQDTQPAAPAP